MIRGAAPVDQDLRILGYMHLKNFPVARLHLASNRDHTESPIAETTKSLMSRLITRRDRARPLRAQETTRPPECRTPPARQLAARA